MSRSYTREGWTYTPIYITTATSDGGRTLAVVVNPAGSNHIHFGPDNAIQVTIPGADGDRVRKKDLRRAGRAAARAGRIPSFDFKTGIRI